MGNVSRIEGSFDNNNCNDFPVTNPPTVKLFSRHVYANFSPATENEINLALQTPRKNLSDLKAQTQSAILEIPNEILVKIFTFLNKDLNLNKDLQTCLFVCKQFNIAVTPLYVKQSLSSIHNDNESLSFVYNDLLELEFKIDANLFDFQTDAAPQSINSLNGKKVTYLSPSYNSETAQKDIQDLKSVSKKVSSFKAHCIFLNQAKQDTQEFKRVSEILSAIIELQKACEFYLEKTEKTLQTQTRLHTTRFHTISNISKDKISSIAKFTLQLKSGHGLIA